MNEQPEALRLADALTEKEYPPRRAAADELRRLHAENERLTVALINICAKCRGNEWGPDTPRKEILAWFHDYAAKEMK
jgi:hypothetical protein